MAYLLGGGGGGRGQVRKACWVSVNRFRGFESQGRVKINNKQIPSSHGYNSFRYTAKFRMLICLQSPLIKPEKNGKVQSRPLPYQGTKLKNVQNSV
jgi:hypothetical protein